MAIPARARLIVDELRKARPESPGIVIAETLLAVGRGDDDDARRELAALVADQPELRAPLAGDPDLGPLVD